VFVELKYHPAASDTYEACVKISVESVEAVISVYNQHNSKNIEILGKKMQMMNFLLHTMTRNSFCGTNCRSKILRS
jgi:hypothetical protein